MPIGVPELLIILVIVLLLFGARRLPEVARGLGTGMREFKDAVTGKSRDDEPEAIEPAPEAAHPEARQPEAGQNVTRASDETRPKAADAS